MMNVRENNNQASKFLKTFVNLLTGSQNSKQVPKIHSSFIKFITGSIVFSFCKERTSPYIFMKNLQYNQFAYSYTGELRNLHGWTEFRKFSTFTELRKILELLDLEDFQDFLKKNFDDPGVRNFSTISGRSGLRKSLTILDLENF